MIPDRGIEKYLLVLILNIGSVIFRHATRISIKVDLQDFPLKENVVLNIADRRVIEFCHLT